MTVSIIPDTAPFNEEQRAWLNGFLAGWVGMEGAETAGVDNGAPVEEPAEEFPWHDSNLSIDERLEMAKEKPLNRRLMSAMAQLDCGACGYLCQTYSEAIATGDEKNLTLCSPGGKETSKALKRLLKEQPASNGRASLNGSSASGVANNHESGFTRSNPYSAEVLSCENLNGEGSAKQTTHAVISLGESGLTYEVGDSLGVYPTNCPGLVAELASQLGEPDNEAFKKRLSEEFNLRDATDELLELLASRAEHDKEQKAVTDLIDSEELDTLDVLDVLRRAPSAQLAPEELVLCLSELSPRLYSIASSIKAHPGEVHLTVGKATTEVGDRVHKGVASTMFADRLVSGDRVRVFVQPSHGFHAPSDPDAPMIMVGPGTGIAPFRAFLEERETTGAKGDNWLFFGDQHAASDFLYEGELDKLRKTGLLTRLSTAFSRDQPEKVYVQDRMREEGAEVFSWLERGGWFFVCGDAKRMANDVDRALHDIIAEQGGYDPAGSKAYVEALKAEGRYSRDVY